MMNLGNVVADSTIRIPFSTIDADGASVTVSNFSAADDIKVYKNNSTTARASSSGYTITTDLDGAGIQAVNIDLSDTAVTDYYEVGSTYDVAVNVVTIDGETVRFWVAKFEIQSAASVGASNRQSGLYHFFKNGTLTVPSWAKSAWVGAVGAGSSGSQSTLPSGGGGGGYAEGNLSVASKEALTVTVGTGGAGSGVSGGNTTVSGSTTGTLVTGGGGSGITGGTGTGGDFQASGGNGGTATSSGTGGGGGAAGTAHGNGGNGGNGTVNGAGGGGGVGGANGGATDNAGGGGGGGFLNGGVATGAGLSLLGALGSNSTDTIAAGMPLTHVLPFGNDGSEAGCGGAHSTPITGVGGSGGIGGGGGGSQGNSGNGGDGYAFVQFFG